MSELQLQWESQVQQMQQIENQTRLQWEAQTSAEEEQHYVLYF